MMIKKPLFAIPVLAVLFALTGPAHAQTCNTVQQSVTAYGLGSGSAAAVATIPGDGYPNSGCTKTVIDYITASMFDGAENCLSSFYVYEGTTTILYRDQLVTNNAGPEDQMARLPALPPPGYLWYGGHNGGLVEFSTYCAHTTEYVNVFFHWQP